MKLFRFEVSDTRSSKDRSKYKIACYGENKEHAKMFMRNWHPYLNIYSIEEVYV